MCGFSVVKHSLIHATFWSPLLQVHDVSFFSFVVTNVLHNYTNPCHVSISIVNRSYFLDSSILPVVRILPRTYLNWHVRQYFKCVLLRPFISHVVKKLRCHWSYLCLSTTLIYIQSSSFVVRNFPHLRQMS